MLEIECTSEEYNDEKKQGIAIENNMNKNGPALI